MLPNYDIFGCNPLNTTKQVSAQLFFLDANVTLFFYRSLSGSTKRHCACLACLRVLSVVKYIFKILPSLGQALQFSDAKTPQITCLPQREL